MPNINLLPWRAKRREKKQKEFVIVLGTVAVFAGLLIGGVWFATQSALDYQQERNKFLTKKIKVVDKKVKEIKQLQEKREQLLDRMRVIQELQGNRPVIVRAFDEMVRIVPDGIHFRSLNSNKNRYSISGIAMSNNRVASLMRRVDESEWFSEPNLEEMKANRKHGEQANNFKMSFKLTPPKSEEIDKEEP